MLNAVIKQLMCDDSLAPLHRGVHRCGDARGNYLIVSHQILDLRNVRNTGIAKLPAQTFATCKRITPKNRRLK